MKAIIIDVDGYRCTVCGHKWLPELILEYIACPKCGAVRENQGRHDEGQGVELE